MKRVLFFIICLMLIFSANAQEIEKTPDARNQELLQFYNKDYKIFVDKIKPGKSARNGFAIYKVSQESIMSNEDIEMFFEVDDDGLSLFDGKTYSLYWYRIMLRNKTDHTIYIDKNQCYRVPSIGLVHCYTDNKNNNTIERILEIPPHTTVPLVKTKYINTLQGYAEHTENFILNMGVTCGLSASNFFCSEHETSDGGITDRITDAFIPIYGQDKTGEVKSFTLENSPFSVYYEIMYSFTREIEEYSKLNAHFYISQWIPLSDSGDEYPAFLKSTLVVLRTKDWSSKSDESIPAKYIDGYNNRMLISPIGYHKVKDYKRDLDVLLTEADAAYMNEDYKNAFKKYNLYNRNATFKTYQQAVNAGTTAFKLSYYGIALEYFKQCYKYRDLDERIMDILPDMIMQLEEKYAIQKAQEAELAAQTEALVNSLTSAINGLTTSIVNYSNTKRRNEQAAKFNALSTKAKFNNIAAKQKTSEVNDNDDDDDKDSGYEKECPKCDGKGFLVIERPHTKAGKELEVLHVECKECGGEYDANAFTHKHETCPKCKGRKFITY